MPGRVTVCGLGPAGPELLTAETGALLGGSAPVLLRTDRHPAAAGLVVAGTYDAVYEEAATFAEVYGRIAADLVDRAAELGEIVYAVPGSPRVLERTVELLAAKAREGAVELDVRPALSFLDLAWVRLGIDPVEEGVRLIDGHRFAAEAAGQRGPLLVAHCHNRRVLSDIKLAVDDPPSSRVLVVQRLGCPDEAITEVEWSDLDRSVEPDHLTSLWIPELDAPIGRDLVAFAELVARLRDECPWDREQTHITLTRHVLEEAYEVVEAVGAWADAQGSEGELAADEHLAEELGDLLFQVVLHAAVGSERGAFDLGDVARGIHDKLVRRHPHVFAPGPDGPVDTASLSLTWEQIKAAETGRESVMDGVPEALPALLHAHKVLRKADAAGFGVASDPASVPTSGSELGERLLALVAAARDAQLDPETELRRASERLRDRVKAQEEAARRP